MAEPESVLEDHDLFGAGPLLLGQEAAAERGLDAEHREEVDREAPAHNLLRLAVAREAERSFAPEGGHLLEDPLRSRQSR